MELFISGLIIGFSIAAAVGPIGLLCIQRTLSQGRVAGLATGLGAASADAVYAALAALGLTAATAHLSGVSSWLVPVGGLILIGLGLKTLRSRPPSQAAKVSGAGLAAMWATTFGLTLTNPMTIISFAAVFAGLGLGSVAGPGSGVVMVGGVFSGSAVWWLLLCGGVGLARQRVTPRVLAWINRLAGGLIIAFGLAVLLRPLWPGLHF